MTPIHALISSSAAPPSPPVSGAEVADQPAEAGSRPPGPATAPASGDGRPPPGDRARPAGGDGQPALRRPSPPAPAGAAAAAGAATAAARDDDGRRPVTAAQTHQALSLLGAAGRAAWAEAMVGIAALDGVDIDGLLPTLWLTACARGAAGPAAGRAVAFLRQRHQRRPNPQELRLALAAAAAGGDAPLASYLFEDQRAGGHLLAGEPLLQVLRAVTDGGAPAEVKRIFESLPADRQGAEAVALYLRAHHAAGTYAAGLRASRTLRQSPQAQLLCGEMLRAQRQWSQAIAACEKLEAGRGTPAPVRAASWLCRCLAAAQSGDGEGRRRLAKLVASGLGPATGRLRAEAMLAVLGSYPADPARLHAALCGARQGPDLALFGAELQAAARVLAAHSPGLQGPRLAATPAAAQRPADGPPADARRGAEKGS